jgi:hypothetical protein
MIAGGVDSGTKMVQGSPTSRAACAVASPALPPDDETIEVACGEGCR